LVFNKPAAAIFVFAMHYLIGTLPESQHKLAYLKYNNLNAGLTECKTIISDELEPHIKKYISIGSLFVGECRRCEKHSINNSVIHYGWATNYWFYSKKEFA